MIKQKIQTNTAPQAIGPYSQAIKCADWVYLSGQIGLDPASGKVVDGGFGAQAKQVLENIRQVVNAAQANVNDIVKLTVYLQDFAQFPVLNELMASYFSEPYPARATVEVSRLPLEVLVEIDAVLYVGN